jgi:hypothetical protein
MTESKDLARAQFAEHRQADKHSSREYISAAISAPSSGAFGQGCRGAPQVPDDI